MHQQCPLNYAQAYLNRRYVLSKLINVDDVDLGISLTLVRGHINFESMESNLRQLRINRQRNVPHYRGSNLVNGQTTALNTSHVMILVCL